MLTNTKFCILFIDNDSVFQKRVMQLLEDDYECHIAGSGKQGLSVYSELVNRKPLVICDYNLRDASGAELCQAIKNINIQAYIIMLFAFGDAASRMQCMQSRADHCLDKQIDDQELRLLIRNVCNTLLAQSNPKVLQGEKKTLRQPKEISLESQVREFIKSFYTGNSSLSEVLDCTSVVMSKKLNMTHRTFQREIKKQSGYSFKQIHLNVRLDQAKKLLACEHKVCQAADSLGFSSPSHLSRAFKNQFGLTPSQYSHQ